MRRLLSLSLLLCGVLFSTVSHAQNIVTPVWWVDELRGGAYWHSVDSAAPGALFDLIDTRRGIDANVELLFTPFALDGWALPGRIRPHIGATINTGPLETMIYAGLSWTWNIFDGPVFIEGTFGGSINNWDPANTAPYARNLGCNLLFRESLSLGVDLSENANVMLTVEHASNAGLCTAGNAGLTNAGLRFGFKF